MPDINPLLEVIKTIDISKYKQEEYRDIVDEVAVNFKAKWYDELYDNKGWRDNGGES